VDFVALRRALAANARWDDELTGSIMPGAARRETLTASPPKADGIASTGR